LHIEQTIACFGLLGNQTKAKELVSALPTELTHNQTASFTHRIIQHAQAYEIWLDAAHLLENTQLNSLPTITNQAWDLTLIRNGIGEVREPTIEELLPQDINLQLTGGVDFKKGCYTGQEIIARMHYRGNLKKHMYRGVASSLVTTDDISSQNIIDADTQKNVGKILFAVKISETSSEFLSMTNDDYIDNKTALLSEHPAAKIEWLPLPYAIT
jgi:folate-binding protein YgfZ